MKSTSLIFTLLMFYLLVGGCAAPQNQGRLVRSSDVDNMVESATVLTGHKYYYTGPEAEPDAIVAIKETYTLTSKYWIEVSDVEEQLKSWNRFIENDTRTTRFYEGARIITPEGQEAGIWYSTYDYTVIRFPDQSSIQIYAPLVPFESRDRNRTGSYGGF